MWNNDSRFQLGYFVCRDWTATEQSAQLDAWNKVTFEESDFDEYLYQLELQMCELFRLSSTSPLEHYELVGDVGAFGRALRAIGWLDMVDSFAVGTGDEQLSAECWVLMLFEERFEFWSMYNPIVDELGNWEDLDDASTHDAIGNAKELFMKIKIAYLQIRGIEHHDYWNYVKKFEDRVFRPAGPQDETDAYSGDSW